MRNVVIGLTLLAASSGGAIAGWVCTSQAQAQRPLREAAAHGFAEPGLLALPADVDERRQLITLIDPQSRSMVVYQIDKPSGEVSLRSVRNIHWDLQMDEFNGKSPLPKEIRSLLETR